MTSQSRKHRGYATQRIVCDGLQDVFPGCYPPGAGESGDDVRNAPGWALEVKARRAFNPLEWMRQLRKRQLEDWVDVAVVMRPDGAGPATLDEWPVFMPFSQFKRMVKNQREYYALMDKLEGK